MIKLSELKQGGHIIAEHEGDKKRGEIVKINNADKQICINSGVQDFWFDMGKGHLEAIPITDDELTNFKFHKLVNDDGTVKYMKGAFRILIPKEGDFSRMEIWYRDEQRHIMEPIPLHVLQNHFYEMTKVFLNEGSFD
ncbi:hypothetical protein ACFOWM_03845 [Ferruginibacter yonginensis]|uniref:Uncharacterized protein n=1 Tax=Ferruginibacter yonginensis TaxID=1310416 RepID=A0ABV8QQM1_9BACT